MIRFDSAGQTLIILLVAIVIIAFLSIYLINRLYLKQSKNIKENELIENDINQSPTLPNAQNQLEAVRNRMNDIQNDYNKKLDNSMIDK